MRTDTKMDHLPSDGERREVIGRVSFANGERKDYTDSEEYLRCIREELPCRPTSGFRYETLTHDPAVRKQVDDILYDLYGEKNPRTLEDYRDAPDKGPVKRYTIDEYLAMMEPVFQQQKIAIEKCVAGLTVHAAGLAAKGRESDISELNRFISDMMDFWAPEAREQHITTFEQTVAAARDSGEAPMLTEQDKTDIRAGLALYAGEIRTSDPELEYWAAGCDSFAEALERQWQTEVSDSQQADPSRQNTTQIAMEMGGMNQ